MYLKNITTLGFKSFADKTALNFMPGITAIVGPNGCGKSNVADALRWVLGEQSAKALRGGEMADVIFNGTDSRKALGMAEVSLTVGDIDHEHLQAAGVDLSYNELTLTRRVFRDGVSEYFINKITFLFIIIYYFIFKSFIYTVRFKFLCSLKFNILRYYYITHFI